MKKTYKVLKGTLVVFLTSAAIVGSCKLVREYDELKGNISNTIDKVQDGFDDFIDGITNKERSTEPSATKTELVEDLGKEVDEALGNTTDWDTSSKPDTYGEALSGVTQAFLDGYYVAETPTDEEIRNAVDDELLNIYELANKKLDEAPKTYMESLERVFNMYTGLNYDEANYNECIKTIKKCTDFVFKGNSFNDVEISFDEMSKETKLYFIDNVLCMDKLINKRYANYKNNFASDSIYQNLDARLILLESHILNDVENTFDYEEYKNKLYQMTFNN